MTRGSNWSTPLLAHGEPGAKPSRASSVRAVHVHVDAALLELRDQVVLAVAPLGVEPTPRAKVLREDALLLREHERAVGAVEVVEAHAVDAEAGEARSEAFRLLVGREVGRAGEVGRVQAHAPPIVREVPVLHADAPVLSGRGVQEMAHVHHIVWSVVGDDEREHPVVRGKSRPSGDRHHRDNCRQDGFHATSSICRHHLPWPLRLKPHSLGTHRRTQQHFQSCKRINYAKTSEYSQGENYGMTVLNGLTTFIPQYICPSFRSSEMNSSQPFTSAVASKSES